MKKRFVHIVVGIIYIALIGMFSYLSLQSGESSVQSSNTVGEIIADLGEEVFNVEIERNDHFFALTRKIVGHYLFFVTIGSFSFLFYFLFKKLNLYIRILIHFVTGLSFAFISEFLFQYIASGRCASISDVGIDFLGFVTLSGIATFIVIFIDQRRKKYAKSFIN